MRGRPGPIIDYIVSGGVGFRRSHLASFLVLPMAADPLIPPLPTARPDASLRLCALGSYAKCRSDEPLTPKRSRPGTHRCGRARACVPSRIASQLAVAASRQRMVQTFREGCALAQRPPWASTSGLWESGASSRSTHGTARMGAPHAVQTARPGLSPRPSAADRGACFTGPLVVRVCAWRRQRAAGRIDHPSFCHVPVAPMHCGSHAACTVPAGSDTVCWHRPDLLYFCRSVWFQHVHVLLVAVSRDQPPVNLDGTRNASA